jgi:phage terminase large subunit-like protein
VNSTFYERARAYARRVIEGEEVAGMYERLACERFEADLKREKEDPTWPFRFSEDAASRVCFFIECLPHIKGKWAVRRELIRLEDWQVFFLVNLFGWVWRKTGLRRFITGYLEVARKNTKSTLGAAIGLYMLAGDGEPGAEVFSAATTGDQARIVFDIAAAMTRRQIAFRRSGVVTHQRGIYIPQDERKFEPLNAEGSTLDGLNIHCVIVDELHAHKRRTVYEVLETARGSREQPLLLAITTAGVDMSGICYEKRDYLTKVLKGIYQDDSLFGIIFALDETDDWQDPRTWRKANPNYGVSVKETDMLSAANAARGQGDARNNFKTKRLNMWVAGGEFAWLEMPRWHMCATKGLKRERFKHLPCYVGLDLASRRDMTAKAMLFVDHKAKLFYLFVDYWLPEEAVDEAYNARYREWVDGGFIRMTEGNETNLDEVEESLRQDKRRGFQIKEVAYDSHNATQLASHLRNDGFLMVDTPQRWTHLSEPMKEIEAAIYSRRLAHDDNPVTNWMASNVIVKPDQNRNLFPRRDRPQNKIDGMLATIMAMGRAIHHVPKAPIDDFINQPVIG